MPDPAVKLLADKLADTVVADVGRPNGNILAVVVPTRLVIVKLCVPIRPVMLKPAGVSVAVVVPLYALVGVPMIDAVSVLGEMVNVAAAKALA